MQLCPFLPVLNLDVLGLVHLDPLGNKSTWDTNRMTIMTLSHCPSLEPPPSELFIM